MPDFRGTTLIHPAGALCRWEPPKRKQKAFRQETKGFACVLPLYFPPGGGSSDGSHPLSVTVRLRRGLLVSAALLRDEFPSVGLPLFTIQRLSAIPFGTYYFSSMRFPMYG